MVLPNNLYAVSNGKEYGHKGQSVFLTKLAVGDNGKFKVAKIKINYYRKEKSFGVTFINTNSKEQKLFAKSLKELFSPLSSPRYLLRKTFFKKTVSRYCLQVPSELAKNKSFVYLFKVFMIMFRGFEVFYCKASVVTRDIALRCQAKCFNKSYFRPITEKQILL